MNFCPLCETVHEQDDPCSIRGLAAVKEKASGSNSPMGLLRPDVYGGKRSGILGNDADRPSGGKVRPSKAELREIISRLEQEKKDRRARKAASQARWRKKKRESES